LIHWGLLLEAPLGHPSIFAHNFWTETVLPILVSLNQEKSKEKKDFCKVILQACLARQAVVRKYNNIKKLL